MLLYFAVTTDKTPCTERNVSVQSSFRQPDVPILPTSCSGHAHLPRLTATSTSLCVCHSVTYGAPVMRSTWEFTMRLPTHPLTSYSAQSYLLSLNVRGLSGDGLCHNLVKKKMNCLSQGHGMMQHPRISPDTQQI